MKSKGSVERNFLRGAVLVLSISLMACGGQNASSTDRTQPDTSPAAASATSGANAGALELASNVEAKTWGSSSKTAAGAVPEALKLYGTASIGSDAFCTFGAISEDGTDQRPYVAVTTQDQGKGKVLGAVDPGLGSYAKGRVTQCSAHGDAIYALVEFDTQLSAQISQTVMEVWKVDRDALEISKRASVRPADVQVKAYSLWMPEGDSRFAWSKDVLEISGNYFPLSNRDDIKPFSIGFDADLNSVADKE